MYALRSDSDERCQLATSFELAEEVRQRRVRKTVGVVGQEHLFVLEIFWTALSRWPMFVVRPVSTNVMRRSAMSLFISPPGGRLLKTKSLEMFPRIQEVLLDDVAR